MALVAWIIACLLHASAVLATFDPNTASTQLCGCPSTCASMGNTTASCTAVSPTFNYTETAPFTCLERPIWCGFLQMSYAIAVTQYGWQDLVLQASDDITCAGGANVRVFFGNGTSAFNASLYQASPSSCRFSVELPFAEGGRLYYQLYGLLPDGDSTTLEVSAYLPATPPTFEASFGLDGFLPSLQLTPLYACCTAQPASVTVDTSCDAVTFSFADGTWSATRAFDTACATTSQALGGGLTQYWFDATIVGEAQAPCDGVDINTETFNMTQITADTGAPTFSPSVNPATLDIEIDTLAVQTNSYLCAPGTISGFARPRVDVVGNASTGTADLAAATIWFPPALWTAQRAGSASWTLTSSACVAQTRDCRVRAINASARAELAVGDVMYIAEAERAYRDAEVECVPRAQCYPDEAQNLNEVYPPQMLVTMPTTETLSLNSTWIVDLVTPTIAPTMVLSVDTVSVTITDLGSENVWSQDIGATQKDYVMRNQSYPEYFDGNFCRFNGSLFYVYPYRWNAYVAANIEEINATVCAYLALNYRDRFTFTPENWVLQNAYCSPQCVVTFEVTGQIRDETSGNFTGCVWTSLNVTIGVDDAATIDAVMLAIIVAFVVAGGIMLAVALEWFRVYMLARRRRELQRERDELVVAAQTGGTPNPLLKAE